MNNSKTDATLHEFINEIVEEIVNEKAFLPSEASSQGLALAKFSLNESVYFVLYRPGELLEFAQNLERFNPGFLNPNQLEKAIQQLVNETTNPVIGLIRIYKDSCAWIVQNSAAEKGYGPMLYDIALSFAGPHGLTSDRAEGVSPSARNIWKHYATQRKAEMRIYPFMEDDECSSFSNDQDSWFLDAKYTLKNPRAVNWGSLLNTSNDTLSQLQSPVPGDVLLRRLGSIYFSKKYTKG